MAAEKRPTVSQNSEATPLRPRRLLQRIFRPWVRSTSATGPGSARDGEKAIDLCHSLLSERGDVSGARRATEALAAYKSLDGPALEVFFDRLIEEFSPDPSRVEQA